ncbi:MAG TPA: MFS transporter [Solirubrobacterales bacterium]|nr:MFS transporter [Solirubrobacterales bacterium]
MNESAPAPAAESTLSSRRGVAILLLLSVVQFMDILDASILNIALPSIKNDLGFSQQGLQWVIDGYILTYGGFLLLGGRMADLLGRRSVLVTGLIVFAGSSLTGGLAHSSSLLIGARFAQGIGAAMMSPAALSMLTSTFRSTRDRNTALGVWAAVSGIGGAAGVLFGGLLTEGPGWRWVLFINVPFSAVALVGAFLLLQREPVRAGRLANFDALGAFFVTGGMLLLVYTLVKAPDVGWGAGRTVAGLAGSAVLLAGFLLNELRVRNPLVPLSILKVKGVAAADATQLVAIAGFLPMFFFLTLYMQTVLHYSPIQTGVAYLPLTVGFIIAASISSQLFARIGTKPVVVLGTVISAAGLYWLSLIPVDGSYVSDILPGLMIVSIGMGGVFTGLTTAANAGVDQDKAGLAAGLLNTGQQLGAALGLAILSAVATAQTKSVLSAGDGLAQAATHGYQRALLVGAFIVAAATALALLTPNTRETTAAVVQEEPALDLAA